MFFYVYFHPSMFNRARGSNVQATLVSGAVRKHVIINEHTNVMEFTTAVKVSHLVLRY